MRLENACVAQLAHPPQWACVAQPPKAALGAKLSSLLRCSKNAEVSDNQNARKNACVAQLAEQLTRNEQVAGSNPATSSTKNAILRDGVFFSLVGLFKCERGIPSPLALSPCKVETCRFCMTSYPSKVIRLDVLFFCVRGGLDLRPIFTGAPRKSASFCGERTNSGASESCRLRRDEGCVACEDAVPPRAPVAQPIKPKHGGT